MYDLVIRGAKIVDGSGGAPFVGDVAVKDGLIAAVGKVAESGREEIDAKGALVTPGFVDIHTHYDGQATWDPYLTPSSLHGVTSIVFGNCGVGFAPVAPGQHEFLIQLMEGVEDIPGTALSEGMQWEWETFPEFLDALERREFAVDIGTQVPHGPVRVYVMGERGAKNEPATAEDIEKMSEIVQEGIEAGALGFSTSRTIVHRAIDGEPVPGTFAAEDEVFGIGRGMQRAGAGIFELAPAGTIGEDELIKPRKELDWMLRWSAEIGRPITFAMVQHDQSPDLWREMLEESAAAVANGSQVFPQVAGRPGGIIMGLEPGIHPFLNRPSYAAIAGLPVEERVAKMRDPELRQKILSEAPMSDDPMASALTGTNRMFPLSDPPNYEPGPEASIAGLAKAQNRDEEELMYELLLQQGGKKLFLYHLLNYSNGNADHLLEMFRHPRAALGLSDGGAHCGMVCDASNPTYMLTHWVRDRDGERIPIEAAVKLQTRDTAELYGLLDRGLIAPGLRADLNVIDFDKLRLHMPEMRSDLPAGGRRFVQGADGYLATIVAGEVVWRNGEATGKLPGRLIRGAQADPRA